MSKSLKGLLALAITAAAANSAMAADGTITFTGEIIAASCSLGATGSSPSVTPGEEAKGKNLIVALGKVSKSGIGVPGGQGVINTAKNIDLALDCTEATDLTSVTMSFDPKSGSGLHPQDSRLLNLTGAGTAGVATNVGIGLYNGNNELLNLGSEASVTGALTKSGEGAEAVWKTNLNLRAGYVQAGPTAITAGTANGTLPFLLSYN